MFDHMLTTNLTTTYASPNYYLASEWLEPISKKAKEQQKNRPITWRSSKNYEILLLLNCYLSNTWTFSYYLTSALKLLSLYSSITTSKPQIKPMLGQLFY